MENTVATAVNETEGNAELVTQKRSTQSRKYVRPSETVAYLLLSFGYKNLDSYYQAFRQFFIISFLGLSGSAYGVIMLFESIYDAVDDSISGLIIDRTRTRWGRLRPWLILPTPFWAIANMMIFTAPVFLVAEWQKIIWVVVAIFVYNLGISYFSSREIMIYNITPNNNERDSLIATAKFMELFGAWLPSIASLCVAIIPKRTNNAIGMQTIYTTWAFILVVISASTAIFGFSKIRERVPLPSREQMQEVGVVESFKNVFKNRPMFVLFLSSFFTGFKSIGVASESFYWMHNSKSLAHGTIASLFTGIPAFILTPIAPKLIRKFGAKAVAVFSGFFAGAAYLGLFLIGITGDHGQGGFLVNWEGRNKVVNLAVIAIGLTICGLPNSLMNVANAVLKGDVYDYSEWKTGVRNEALVQTVQNYFDKAASAITQLLSGVVISAVGYVAHKDEFGNIIAESNRNILLGFFAIFCLLPSIARFLYGITLLFFNVTGDVKKEMLADLEVSRRERLQKMNAEADAE